MTLYFVPVVCSLSFNPEKYKHLAKYQNFISSVGIPGYSFYVRRDSKCLPTATNVLWWYLYIIMPTATNVLWWYLYSIMPTATNVLLWYIVSCERQQTYYGVYYQTHTTLVTMNQKKEAMTNILNKNIPHTSRLVHFSQLHYLSRLHSNLFMHLWHLKAKLVYNATFGVTDAHRVAA